MGALLLFLLMARLPLDVVLVVDRPIAGLRWPEELDAASRVGVVDFARGVRARLALTPDRAAVEKALARAAAGSVDVRFGPMAAGYPSRPVCDAAAEAARMLGSSGSGRRKVIVVYSLAEQTKPRTAAAAAANVCLGANAAVIAALPPLPRGQPATTVPPPGLPGQSPPAADRAPGCRAETLARETRGRVVKNVSPQALLEAAVAPAP